MIPVQRPFAATRMPTLAQGQTLGNAATLGNPQAAPSPAEQLAALLAQHQSSQDRMEMGAEMQGAEYINNSGSLGVLAALANKYMGGRIRRKEGEKASDLTQRILSAQTEAEKQKLIEAAQRQAEADRIARERRMQEGQQAGLKERELYEYAFTGKFPEGAKPPSSFQEFQLSQENPEFGSFLNQRDKSKGTNVSVTMPGQHYQKPFDEALAKSDVGRYEKAMEGAQAAQTVISNVDALDAIFANTKTGKPQEFYGVVGQYFGAPAGATYQAQKAIVESQVNDIISTLPGVATDKDADRVRAMIPNMGTDPRARKVVTDYIRHKARATIDEAGRMEQHLHQNRTLQGYRPQLPSFEVDASPVGGRGLSPQGQAAYEKYKPGR